MSYHARRVLTPGASRKRKEREAEPDRSNQLLAGYMAHEFLTRGTLLGKRWDPARLPEAAPVIKVGSAESVKSYAEVARLLKGDGAHVAGVVNPAQLARWINSDKCYRGTF